MSPQRCRLCHQQKAPAEFLAGKARRQSSTCATCRAKLAAQHRRKYFAQLPPDERHTRTHKRRADAYGVEHVAYSRTDILVRWRGRCAYCDALAEHLDHVHPLSKGGADAEHNIVPACRSCNLSKGAKTLAEWAETFGPAEATE